MFDWMLPKKHAIAILKKDHERVKGYFDEFEEAESPGAKEKFIGQAVTALKIHAVLEEEIFYPAVRAHVGNEVMNEADEEHHLAKVLIAELNFGKSKNGHRFAKFTVLAESVRHHIKEEEDQMLPKAKELDIDFEALGKRMLDRKTALQAGGIPSDSEHAIVEKAHGKGDSPAAAVRRSKVTTKQKAPATASNGRVRKSAPRATR